MAETASAGADAAAPGDVRPTPDIAPVEALRAGSVDDNADFDDFLTYLRRAADSGIASRPFDPSGRLVVRVVGSDGRPVDGAEVTISDPEVADATITLRTDAAGTVRWFPNGGPGPLPSPVARRRRPPSPAPS